MQHAQLPVEKIEKKALESNFETFLVHTKAASAG
jgi:hypothetical protein